MTGDHKHGTLSGQAAAEYLPPTKSTRVRGIRPSWLQRGKVSSTFPRAVTRLTIRNNILIGKTDLGHTTWIHVERGETSPPGPQRKGDRSWHKHNQGQWRDVESPKNAYFGHRKKPLRPGRREWKGIWVKRARPRVEIGIGWCRPSRLRGWTHNHGDSLKLQSFFLKEKKRREVLFEDNHTQTYTNIWPTAATCGRTWTCTSGMRIRNNFRKNFQKSQA